MFCFICYNGLGWGEDKLFRVERKRGREGREGDRGKEEENSTREVEMTLLTAEDMEITFVLEIELKRPNLIYL